MQSVPFDVNSGDNVVISGVSGYIIEIFCIYARLGALSTLALKSDTTVLAGPMPFVAGGSFDVPMSTQAAFRCAVGEDFVLDLTGLGASCGGVIFYDLTL